jgi:hypothetical protein
MGADVGALVEPELVIKPQDDAVGINRHPHMVALLTRMVRSHQVLAAVLDPFDRVTEPECGEADQEVLGVKLAANAEATAGVALFQHHSGGAATEETGERVAVAVRHLGGSVQLQHVARGLVAS